MKKLVLFGTRHYEAANLPESIRNTLNVIITEFIPQVVLEEWSVIRGQSGASVAAAAHGVTWKSIGTPPTPELESYGNEEALDHPMSANIQRYGPLASQETREKLLCKNIATAVSAYQTALVVIGLGHLHSMMVKLSGQFEVDGYGFGLELF
jgi:hypothetical protein